MAPARNSRTGLSPACPKPVPLLAGVAVALNERRRHHRFRGRRRRRGMQQLLVANHQDPLRQTRDFRHSALQAFNNERPRMPPPNTWPPLKPWIWGWYQYRPGGSSVGIRNRYSNGGSPAESKSSGLRRHGSGPAPSGRGKCRLAELALITPTGARVLRTALALPSQLRPSRHPHASCATAPLWQAWHCAIAAPANHRAATSAWATANHRGQITVALRAIAERLRMDAQIHVEDTIDRAQVPRTWTPGCPAPDADNSSGRSVCACAVEEKARIATTESSAARAMYTM